MPKKVLHPPTPILVGSPIGLDIPEHPRVLPFGEPLSVTEGVDQLNATLASDEYAVPLTEEWVLSCGLFNEARGNCGLGLDGALSTVDRVRQRHALPRALNPKWISLDGKWVAKRRQSTMNEGVMLPVHLDLMEVDPQAHGFVIEEYIEGEQCEVNAIVDVENRIQHVWPTLSQDWNADGTKIVGYSGSWVHFPVDLLQTIAEELNIRACAMNVEFRHQYGEDMTVIEVHSRFGEDDKDYYRQWDSDPIGTLLEAL